MSSERKPIDFGGLGDLDEFQPKPAKPERARATPAATKKAVDQITAFPSRESGDEGQMNVRAPEAVLARFRAMAKADRYTLGAFLEILMDAYEQRK